MVPAFSGSILCRQGARDASLAVAGIGETQAHMATDKKKSFIFALLRRWCCLPLGNQFHHAVDPSKRAQATAFLTERRISVIMKLTQDYIKEITHSLSLSFLLPSRN